MKRLFFAQSERRCAIEICLNTYSFHGLVRLTRSIPFDIEKVALQTIEIKAEILKSV